MPQLSVRAPKDVLVQIDEACLRDGSDRSVFVRQAVIEKLSREVTVDRLQASEDRITNTVNALRQEVAQLFVSMQALIAHGDTFIKLYLSCTPEPADPEQARAQAKHRYQHFQAAVAAAYSNGNRNGVSK